MPAGRLIDDFLFAPFAALLIEPFGLGFMRRALAGCIALSLAGPPLGVLLVLRRMSLTSEVLQHGVLPGVALGAVFGGWLMGGVASDGVPLWFMGAGGFLAGLAVVLLAGVLARATGGREDSQLAGLYLLAEAHDAAPESARRQAA